MLNVSRRAQFSLVCGAMILGGAAAEAKTQQSPVRITQIGMSPTFTQMDGCYLRPPTGGSDFEAYGEIDVQSGTLRLSVNSSEVSGPINVRTGVVARTGVARGYRFAMTPFGLRTMPYAQFTVLTVSSPRGRASRRFKVECMG